MAEYGFPATHATAAAAATARAIAGGDVGARWRILDDDVIEVARDSHGRVELCRIAADGRTSLVERSRRSWLRAGGKALQYAGGALVLATFVGAALANGTGHEQLRDRLITAFILVVLSVFVVQVVTPSSDKVVRRWIRKRFGTDEGWSRVPREADIDRATGNQQVIASSLADGARREALARLRDDGTLEVATRARGMVTVHYVDRTGHITHTVRQGKRDRPSLTAESDWRSIRTNEPGD
jgi:hypothetical protein